MKAEDLAKQRAEKLALLEERRIKKEKEEKEKQERKEKREAERKRRLEEQEYVSIKLILLLQSSSTG